MAIRILRNMNFHGRDSACPLLIRQTIMLFYIIVVVPAFIITLHAHICNAQATICNRSFNYTKGSEFESNLDTVFNSLIKDTSQTGYNTSVHGQSPNQIYGLLICRGDATADQCYNCSQRATTAIRKSEGCGKAVGATIWMDVCFLRYENYTFFGELDSSIGLYTYITANASEPEVFNAAVQKLLSNLSTEAESGPKLYASGNTTDSLFRKIYGLVQCWRDISTDDCTTCLSNTINSLSVAFPGNPGVQGLMANCIIRYETYPFFNLNALPPSPVEAPANAPANESPKIEGDTVTAPKAECGGDFNYPKGSEFESNLNTVFKNLVDNINQTGFSTSEYGQNPYQMYGLLQCRGDTTVGQCYICSQNATTTIRQSCGNAIGSSIWFEFCFLRYANYKFFGKLDTSGINLSGQQSASETEPFNEALRTLFNNLTGEAAIGSASWNRYASGTITDTWSRDIYALVQCWRDISIDSCTQCLLATVNSVFLEHPGMREARGLTRSCIVRYDTNPFFGSTVPRPSAIEAPTTPRPSAAEAPANARERSSSKTRLILGVVGGFLAALLVCVFATGRKLKSAIKLREYEGNSQGLGQVEEDTLISEDGQLVVFKMDTLLAATENFHYHNKLGEGGFGPVYKGTTQDGKEIAAKKMSLNSEQGKKEFLNEVKLVAKIQHRNLVKLLGYCAAGSEMVLVYEYLPNKSLDKILFHPNNREQLDWQKRYNIILGVARGLLYLHQDSLLRIIHRDIKASNILLDEKLNPKIADFGLAKHFAEDESHVSTRLAGTFGYMAPEYAMQGQLSVKADVYSFGVLLLELITGRKNTDYSLSPEMQILLGWAWRSYERGNIVQMIDPAIIETCNKEQALRCIHVGLLCTQAEASLRPLMCAATMMLSSDSATLPNPTKPVFVSSITQITRPTGSGSVLSHASASTTSSSSLTPVAPVSNAYLSGITELVPR